VVAGTINNLSGYRLIDPQHNICVEGERFDLSAEYVIKSCKQLEREDDEDEYIHGEMEEFYEEEGRDPYSSHKFTRWLAKRQLSCAQQIRAQFGWPWS
jgi:hypothetical protein